MENSLGVRKGAWTAQEDELLKGCIEKYGEGKWHLVPLRAELNRCRKSCRLRWLNYVKPNIKRGQFTDDEVDLICRLHKLLGNRWSLIAGRLSGRTTNDVKNYWNTHLRKKTSSNLTYQVKEKPVDIETIVKTKAIRPLPHTFKTPGIVSNAINTSNHIHTPCNSPFSSATQKEDDELWLENLLIDDDATNFSIIDWCEEGHNSNTNPWTQDIESFTRVGEENCVESGFAFGACFFESF